MKRILTISSVILVALVFSTAISAQTRNKKKRVAEMFDEFGSLRYCDATAHLDNFAIQILSPTSQTGYVVVYGAPGEEPGSGSFIAQRLKNYLVNSRGIEDEKVALVYAGRNDDPKDVRVQLWIGPNGAPAPEPKKFNANPASFKGMYEESEGDDEITNYTYEGDGEGETLFPGVWLANFLDVTRSQPGSLIYIVGYNGASSVPGAWRRMAEGQAEIFKKSGIDANRFKIIYGGDEAKPKVRIWIEPATEPAPVKDAGLEPSLKLAVQLGDFGDLDLGEKAFERKVFNRLVETLRAFPTLRACLIVRVEQPSPKEDEAEEFPPVQQLDAEGNPLEYPNPDPEPANLLKLVESWKSELAKQNIREDRLVILFSKALPDYSASVETWLVPIGQPLPDPEKILKEAEEKVEGLQVKSSKP